MTWCLLLYFKSELCHGKYRINFQKREVGYAKQLRCAAYGSGNSLACLQLNKMGVNYLAVAPVSFDYGSLHLNKKLKLSII